MNSDTPRLQTNDFMSLLLAALPTLEAARHVSTRFGMVIDPREDAVYILAHIILEQNAQISALTRRLNDLEGD